VVDKPLELIPWNEITTGVNCNMTNWGSQEGIHRERGVMNGCSFCMLTVRKGAEDWNQPLLESDHFMVLPSLGALVEGWLLIVPKSHLISMGELSKALESEFLALKCEVVQLVENLYGSAATFEHGPSATKHQVGCGVDHAHLHVVPVAHDLEAAVAPFLPTDAQWNNADLQSCRDAFRAGTDYLYLESRTRRGRILVHDQLGSQLFRRAIAQSIGAEGQFNWRQHPQFVNTSKTIDSVRKAILAGSTCLVGSENAT
jgi:ATP adenylyltransferase